MSIASELPSKFTLTHSWNDIELSVSIDFSIITVDQIKAYVENHFDRPSVLVNSDDEIIGAFLKILARTCFKVCLLNDFSVDGLRDYFNNPTEWGAELFPPMDGSKGIMIESFVFDELDERLFEIEG